MTAAVLPRREDLRIEQVPMPKAGAGGNRRPCARRAHLWTGTSKLYRRGYHARMLKPPIPFGHELAGTVHQVGRGVAASVPENRVVALNSAPLRRVLLLAATSRKTSATALIFNNGAYAEYLLIPSLIVAKNTLRIPPAFPLNTAALTEALACVVQRLG